MRVLLLFRGAPGCGKSTFIKEHGLQAYALSADDIRLQCQSPQQNIYGEPEISGNNEKTVWSMLFKLLEVRMQRGEFVVIDATNSKSVEMNRYKQMAESYRYRIFCIDLTTLPIEECKRRNALREPLKRVPEEAIEKMYARFENQGFPSGIKVIEPEELDSIFIKRFDMSEYEKIVHIGDIHGCYTALMEYFKDGFNDNYFYIFLGDYIDRGIENPEVVKFMIEACKRRNVLCIEGNHERWLWIYANGGIGYSKEFEFVTKPTLEASDIDVKDIRQFYRKLGQCAWYNYGDKEILVTHGGIANFPDNLGLMATEQMIKGVGKYDDYETVSDSWMKNTADNMYQIFGHRNTRSSDIQLRERIFNLEGSVEFGGHLRIVELDKDGFHPIEIKNDIFKEPTLVQESSDIIHSSTADVVMALRTNKFINEKKYGNISSFNFNNHAFYNSVWDEQTITARGLFINTRTMKIVARSFNKFFNINERPETKFDMLKYKLQFPVTCYVKENGYLGLISYNEETDSLFISSKSDPEGQFSIWLKEMIDNKMSEDNKNAMKEICKNENVTFVVESVDMKNDPHIIYYPDSELFLLAIVKNEINFQQYDYDKVVEIGNKLGLTVKTKAYVINDWSEFYDWYTEVSAEDYEYDGHTIEGFVIEDSAGYMVKAKLFYYKYWKSLRHVAHITLKSGYIRRTGMLTDATQNEFYAFCQKLYKENTREQLELIPRNMVWLRNEFYKNKGKEMVN